MDQVADLETFLDTFDFKSGRKSTERVKLQLQEDYHTAKHLFMHGEELYQARDDLAEQKKKAKESKNPEDYKRHKLVEMLCKIVNEMKEIDQKKLEMELKLKKVNREYSELQRSQQKVDFELTSS